MSALGDLLEQARRAQGRSRIELARAVAIGNPTKNMRLLLAIERGEYLLPPESIWRRFASALGLADEQVLVALSTDFAWLDRPTQPQMIERLFPAVYRRIDLPDGCTREEAVEIARDHARAENRRVAVQVSRIRSIYIDAEGVTRECYSVPRSTLMPRIDSLRVPDSLARTRIESPAKD